MSAFTDTITASDIVDTARATVDRIDIVDVGTISDAIADTASDVLDVAGQATTTGGRLVVRTARAGGRAVRRHPKGSVGTFALIIAVIAAAAWFNQRRDTSTPTDLKVAA